MQVRKFEAVDMPTALKLVKRQLGSDAVILSTRKVRRGRGSFGILGRQVVEVTAAADPDNESCGLGLIPTDREKYSKVDLVSNPLQKDIEELKTMVQMLSRNNLPEIPPFFSENLLSFYRRIVRNGVEQKLALDIMQEVRDSLSEDDAKKDEKVRGSLSRILKRLVMVSGPLRIKEGEQQVMAFVGPTGVGKTTTIAKIAAKQALEGQRKVVLITLDTYRIAAIEQLKTYAKIIGIPVEVALYGNELRTALEAHRDKDLILVDTAGRSQRSQSQMSELTAFFTSGSRIEINLVLSTTTTEENLNDIFGRFQVISINKLLFTKLDESSTFGTILNQAVHSKVPLSYFTTGQKVPEDIEVATVERLLDLILR